MSASRLKPATKRHNAGISMAYGCTIDTNTYCYRLIGGKQVFSRVKLGRGWENIPFDVTKLSCCEKGEETMAHKTGPHENWLDWGVLMPQARKLLATGKSIPRTADILGIKVDTLRKRLKKEKAQTEPGGDQPDPATNEGQSAENIIPESELFNCDNCGGYFNGIMKRGDCQYCASCMAFIDGHETKKEPERTYTAPLQGRYDECDKMQRPNMTINKYYEMVNSGVETAIPANEWKSRYYPLTDAIQEKGEAERQAGWNRYCENQAVESLRQGWAVDIFRHRDLSREKKLELIGRLLDWGVGDGKQ